MSPTPAQGRTPRPLQLPRGLAGLVLAALVLPSCFFADDFKLATDSALVNTSDDRMQAPGAASGVTSASAAPNGSAPEPSAAEPAAPEQSGTITPEPGPTPAVTAPPVEPEDSAAAESSNSDASAAESTPALDDAADAATPETDERPFGDSDPRWQSARDGGTATGRPSQWANDAGWQQGTADPAWGGPP